MKMFSSIHLEIPTGANKKLNATGSSRLVEQWEHCTELHGEYVEK